MKIAMFLDSYQKVLNKVLLVLGILLLICGSALAIYAGVQHIIECGGFMLVYPRMTGELERLTLIGEVQMFGGLSAVLLTKWL